MVTVIGVRFKKAGKIYYFDPDEIEIQEEGAVIVETARGIEYGQVIIPKKQVDDSEVIQPLKKVIRVATEEDDLQNKINKQKEQEAFVIGLEKIKEHQLDMKLIDVEITFDNNKILFYFTSDGRIDFRELVKDLAAIFKTRIELRQIGVRDETKMMGGLGICGKSLCCSSFLTEFQPVSIKMAKEQNLSLNPTKISGVCGRLMCCLKYEEETYEYLNENLPHVGSKIQTPDGIGEVLSVNVLRQLVRAAVRKKDQDDTEVKVYALDEIRIVPTRDKTEPNKDNVVDTKIETIENIFEEQKEE
ncbi:MAG: stage 0 sporulation family protein [Epulopiscium sp.]|nr:stage 0 sporulation family protein [Candidatus Epulonipiscium sp.]